MSNKKVAKSLFGNSIFKNILVMIIIGVILVILSLIFLNFYTRHGHNVVVPRLEGLQIEEANTILNAKGLHVEIVDSVYRRDAVPGAILDQTPKAGNKVKEGRSIYITIYSRTPQQVSVPGLEDYSSRQAIALLKSMGFNQLNIEETPSQFDGLVVAVKYRGQTLSPNEKVPAGSPLTLVVTRGAHPDSLNVFDEYIDLPQTTDENNILQNSGDIDD